MTGTDTASFFTTRQTRDVPRDQWKRYLLPGPDGQEKSWTRATTFAATLAEQYGLRIWKERQVVWGLSRRPDLLTMASTIAGPEDKKALGAIVDEAHIAAGTQAKANRGTAIHTACAAVERSTSPQEANSLVPDELRPHVTAYLRALADNGLRILPNMIERTVIVNRYGVAGTFDNLVICPDGQLRVLDKKTGRLDYSDTEIAVQVALYANADAIFDYDTGQYEPMPEVAKDYAILAHIDPETGHTELQRVNIQWGWVWARTCAEVMDIRKTKHTITPYVSPEWEGFGSPPGFDMKLPESSTVPNVTSLPVASNGYVDYNQQVANDADMVNRMQAFGATQQEIDQFINPGTVPGGFVNSTSPINPEYQAFWSDDRHDYEPDIDDTATVNGVPLAQYGQPSTHPCERGEQCVPLRLDGRHTDGSVCFTDPINTGASAIPAPEHTSPSPRETAAVVSEGVSEDLSPAEEAALNAAGIGEPTEEQLIRQETPLAARESNVDELIARLDKLKTKALVQQVAKKLMASLGIKEGGPGSIKLSTYKVKIAQAIVTMAAKHNVPIPGPEDGDPDFGVPTGPAPDDNNAGGEKPVAPKQDAAALHEEKVRTAVESIRQQNSIAGLQERHTYYTGTSLGWTDEMQDAARTRAAELESSAGEQALTPIQMIEGATSRETLSKAWAKATENGTKMDAWTYELNQAAMSKDAQLAAGVAPSGN